MSPRRQPTISPKKAAHLNDVFHQINKDRRREQQPLIDPYSPLPRSQQVQDALGCDSPTAFTLLEKQNQWVIEPLRDAVKHRVIVKAIAFRTVAKEILATITLGRDKAVAEATLGQFGAFDFKITKAVPNTLFANHAFSDAVASLRQSAKELREKAILNMHIPGPK